MVKLTSLTMAVLRFLVLSLLSFSAYALPAKESATASTLGQFTCAGDIFTYQELAGYGVVASDFRDKFGDTVSFGSSIAIERPSWKKNGASYEGILWMLPDRGW